MIKYEYAKRLQIMVIREMSLELRERSLEKATNQYNEKLEDVELRYYQQNERFDQIKKSIEAERQMIEQCEKLCFSGEKILADAYAKKAEKEATAKQRLADAKQTRKELNAELFKIYSLKLATNTYINLKALPQRIQGVAIIETEDRRNWRPFSVEPLSHSREELKKIIWADSENAADYSEAWEELVFLPLREIIMQQSKDS